MKGLLTGGCAVLIWSLSLTGTASAQNRDFKTALEECFWGLILTNENQRGLSLGLNVVSGALGSYAYTSATASADTFCAEKTSNTASFINDSYPALVEDTARGSGEYLNAVLELAGCDATGRAAAIPLVRADMAKALSADDYNSSNYLDKVHTMYQSINIRSVEVCNVG